MSKKLSVRNPDRLVHVAWFFDEVEARKWLRQSRTYVTLCARFECDGAKVTREEVTCLLCLVRDL